MKKSGIQICPNKPLKLRLIQHWQLYLLLAPAVLYLILVNYAPLYGLIIAFKVPLLGLEILFDFLIRINSDRYCPIQSFYPFIP